MPVSTARGRLGSAAQNLQVRQDAGQGGGYTGSPPLWTAPPFLLGTRVHWLSRVAPGEADPARRRLSQSHRGQGWVRRRWGRPSTPEVGPAKLVLATQRSPSHTWLRLPGPQVGTNRGPTGM